MIPARPGARTPRLARGLAWLLGSLALSGLALAAWLGWQNRPPLAQPPAPTAPISSARAAQFVGAAVCAACHQAEHAAWRGSHHGLAMQAVSPATVLAPFRGEQFIADGARTTFSQRNGKYFVQTTGPDGRLQDFEVTHTLGLTPLQQYLIPMPNQGMQALTIAWDTRPKAQGGQRWFHLHAGQRIGAGDPLHWTGRQNNWNFMCAECHTTQFKKNFDARSGRYNSTWSELSVACEACHGPGSRHVEWAGQPAQARLADRSHGLVQALDGRKNSRWTIHNDTGNAQRSTAPSAPRNEVDMCARCHAHRSQIGDDYLHGKPLLDTHVPSLLERGLFWGDGQMKAEVYNYASFQQSKMFQKGVTCSDCHNPHTLKLRAPGNQTCLQCHAVDKYEAPTHHFHKAGSTGASCAGCHMPTTTYMSVDPRHDHSIRVPRPDLSQRNGTPNACTQCHAGKSAQWATQWAGKWYPALGQRQTPLDQALLDHERGGAQAQALLSGVVEDRAQSSIARASALSRLAADMGPAQLERVTAGLTDPDPLLRLTAVDALAGAPSAVRSARLKPLLGDPVRAVRTAAARWLAGLPTAHWSATDQAALRTATSEYIAVQQFNADRPEAHNNLGLLYADQSDWGRAEDALKAAVAMDSHLTASALNLADVYRAQGRENKAQALIQQVVRQHPEHAVAWHALGLSRLRQGQGKLALDALSQAWRREPGNARFAYVYALALDRQGQTRQALATLQTIVRSHPGHRDAATALAAFCGRIAARGCRPAGISVPP